jgi:hypothetical protein
MKKSIKKQTELNFAPGGTVAASKVGTFPVVNNAPPNIFGGNPNPNPQGLPMNPTTSLVGSAQVVVYGPDGTAYANPAAAQAAGVTNYTMTKPILAPAGKAAAPMQAASAQFQPLGGTKFIPTTSTSQQTIPTFQETIGMGVPYVDYDPNAPDGTEQPETPAEVTPSATEQQPSDDGDGGGGDGTGTSPSSTTSSGKLPSVLSLGNLFSGKTSKTGVKGESIFGSGVGVAEEYDPSKRSLSGLGALGMNPNTNFKNNMGEIGNALGIYGTDGINVGAIFSVLTGSLVGSAASASGLGPNTNLGYKEAPKGFGSFTTDDLIAYTKNEMAPQREKNLGIDQMSKQQAMQRAQVQRQIGTTLTGRYGFSKGSIDPNTGLVYDVTGRAVNYNGNGTGVDNSFSTGKDWVDAVKASVETGYWGGPLSVQDFNKLSPAAKANYNKKFEILGHDEAQGGVGGESKAAETNISKGPEAGIGPTGRKSSTGRQDYSGGITQTSTPSKSTSDYSNDYGNEDEGQNGGENESSSSSSTSGSDGIGDAGQGGPGGYGESYGGIFNKGGLAKQMKRSGLASKK